MSSSSSMEFDFKTLKRKDLQRLCKKHGLRANSTNSQMADGLASLFKNYEMDKQLKVFLRGSVKSSNKECERVDGKAERILIVIDDEDEEHVPVVGSGVMEYMSMNHSSCGETEDIQADLEGSSVRGENKGEKLQPCEENSSKFLDDEDLQSGSAPRSANREHDTCSRKNEINVCKSGNSEVLQIPVVKLKKTSCDGKTKRKYSRKSSMKVNDEAAVFPHVEASHKDNLMITEEYELHTDRGLNTSVFENGGTKRPQKITRASLEGETYFMEKGTNELIQPAVDSASLEILESRNPSSLASSTPRLFLSELQDGLDGGEVPEANEPFRKHRKEEPEQEESEFHRNSSIADITYMEVVHTSGRMVSTSEFDSLSTDEESSKQSSAAYLSNSQQIHDISNERCLSSANHSKNFETEESLVYRNSIITGITSDEGRLSSSELDHVSKDEKTSKQSLFVSLSNPEEVYDISKRCCSISTDHVINCVDDCKKCLVADEKDNSCTETPVSINGFCLSSEQGSEALESSDAVVKEVEVRLDSCGVREDSEGCEALESADVVVKEVEVRLGCHNSGGVREDREGEKRNESIMEHEYQKDKQDENECQEGFGDMAEGNCSFEKASPILFQEISIVEDDIEDKNSPSEIFEEMNDKVGLTLNIEIHDDINLHYLVGKGLEKVGREEFQVAEKKVENVITLAGCFCEALGENSSMELKLTDAREVTANNLLTQDDLGELRSPDNKFQEQTADYEQNLGMPFNKLQVQTADSGHDLGISGETFQEQMPDFRQGYCEDINEKSENFQKFLDSQHLAEIHSSPHFETYESATLPEELSEVKDGGSFRLEGTIQLISDAEILCGSEEPAQLVVYNKDLEVSPMEKITENVTFGLSKRVDKLMEKLLCLRKVLRGEITPPVTDSCLQISCEESHPTDKKELLSDQKDKVVKTLMLSNSMHEDCEQYSSNSQLNIINNVGAQSFQEILDSQTDPTHKMDEVRCMESLEDNNTATTSLFKYSFNCKSIEGQPHQGSDIDVKQLFHSPEKELGKKDFLSTSKHSIDWEGENNSVAFCISKKAKLKHSPSEDNNDFGPQYISDALDGHIPFVQECDAHNKSFDMLEVESENNSLSRTDTFTSVLRASSASRNTVDLVEEISHKLINFRISSTRKATKSSIKTPRTKSTGIFKLHSSVGIIKDKENKQNKTMNFSSAEHKIRSSASAGSLRRPLRSVTNLNLD